jgi:hypothetical protein
MVKLEGYLAEIFVYILSCISFCALKRSITLKFNLSFIKVVTEYNTGRFEKFMQNSKNMYLSTVCYNLLHRFEDLKMSSVSVYISYFFLLLLVPFS